MASPVLLPSRVTEGQGPGLQYRIEGELLPALHIGLDVEPGSWVYREDSVRYEQKLVGFKAGLLGGGGTLCFNRFTGPGRLGLQSGYFSDFGQESAAGARTPQQSGGALGGVIGGLLGG
jgi:uncharacterized protein (AIM24 family)